MLTGTLEHWTLNREVPTQGSMLRSEQNKWTPSPQYWLIPKKNIGSVPTQLMLTGTLNLNTNIKLLNHKMNLSKHIYNVHEMKQKEMNSEEQISYEFDDRWKRNLCQSLISNKNILVCLLEFFFLFYILLMLNVPVKILLSFQKD